MMITEYTDRNIVKKAVFKRPDDANKGTLGSLLSICGSYSMAGAAIMAGKASLRCGLGLLKCALPKSIYPIAAQAILESVFLPLEETEKGSISANNIPLLLGQTKNCSAVLIGCGLSADCDTKQLVISFIKECNKPMVLDADALNCIADCTEVLKNAKAPVIITPHPGEMARLVGKTAKEVNLERQKIATEFAAEHNVITVLKGAGTVIASPDGRVMLNRTGNSGMATGGSGDVLAGMTASLLAQGGSAFDCAAAAVYLHGLAGDMAAKKFGKISMLPTDMIDCIPSAFASCGFA